jgi:protein TonB
MSSLRLVPLAASPRLVLWGSVAVSAALHAGAGLIVYLAGGAGPEPPVLRLREGERALRIRWLPVPLAERAEAAEAEAAEVVAPGPRRAARSRPAPLPAVSRWPAPPPILEALRSPPALPEAALPRAPPREIPLPAASPPPLEPPALPEPPSLAPAGVERGARAVFEPAPVYPRRCRRLGHEGTVVLECLVEADGRVDWVRVLRTSGCGDLDEAAALAVRGARFEPARRGGRAVAGRIELPVVFRLAAR